MTRSQALLALVSLAGCGSGSSTACNTDADCLVAGEFCTDGNCETKLARPPDLSVVPDLSRPVNPDLSAPPPDLTAPPNTADNEVDVAGRVNIDPTTVFGVFANSTTGAPYTCATKALTAPNCSLFTCTGNLAGTGAVVSQSAGIVTVTDGKIPIMLAPDPMTKMYTQYLDFTHAAWPVGSMLTISAAGADVPAFSGMLMTMAAPKFSAPVVMFGMTIARAAPLHVAWSGGTSGVVSVTVDGAETDTSLKRVICSFPVANGSGDVPVEGLMMIDPGMGSFFLDIIDQVHMKAGSFNVTLTLATTPLDTNSLAIPNVTATIQ